MFHKHKWYEKERVYNAPRSTLTKVSGVDTDSLLKLTYGFTTMISHCISCGKLRVITCVGDVT